MRETVDWRHGGGWWQWCGGGGGGGGAFVLPELYRQHTNEKKEKKTNPTY